MALRNGLRLPVGMHDVFPHGCHLLPDSITEAMDYDEKTKQRRPAIDKLTGQRVWQCRVSDMDPDLEGRSRETVELRQSGATMTRRRKVPSGTQRARPGPANDSGSPANDADRQPDLA
jgi:hypothetical protein